MSLEAWIGIAAILTTLIIAVAGALVAHIRHDERRESRLTQVEKEIGTHETGIRGELHRQVNLVSRLRAVVYFIGKALKLDVMKDLDDDK